MDATRTLDDLRSIKEIRPTRRVLDVEAEREGEESDREIERQRMAIRAAKAREEMEEEALRRAEEERELARREEEERRARKQAEIDRERAMRRSVRTIRPEDSRPPDSSTSRSSTAARSTSFSSTAPFPLRLNSFSAPRSSPSISPSCSPSRNASFTASFTLQPASRSILRSSRARSFFTRFPPHLHSASPKKWPISVHLSFVFLLFVYQKSTRNALESFGFQGVFTFPAPVLSTKRLP